MPTEVSRERLQRAQHDGRGGDKFEREDAGFFDRVRNAYRDRARGEPGRFRVVDSTRPIELVRDALATCLDELERS